MKAPWTNKTGLAKLIAIFATMLLISLGLCGANLVTLFASEAVSSQHRISDILPAVLLVTGYLELAVILISIAGLVVTGILTFIVKLREARHLRK